MSWRRALLAAAILAVLLAVPFWEGNLALADGFAILPTTLAVLCCLRGDNTPDRRRGSGFNLGWTLLAGVLFGLAFLIRPTAGAVAMALVLWLFISGRSWFWRGAIMAASSAVVALSVAGAFALLGSFYWFWDANVGFFFEYVPSGKELPFHHRPLIVTPAIVTIIALAWLRYRGELPRWGLPALWLTSTLAVALLTGRPYSHYLLQVFPALALVMALLVPGTVLRQSLEPGTRNLEPGPVTPVPDSRFLVPALAIASSVALLWLTVVMPAFSGNPFAMRYTKDLEYYVNFTGWATGLKDTDDYNTYFDRRVNLTERLDTTLTRLGARGEEVYIWGEVPWAYALADTEPSLRYMTSFYVLLIPYLDTNLGRWLIESDPRFIVVLADAWPRIGDDTGVLQQRYLNATRSLHGVLARRYEQVEVVGRARIFERTAERPTVIPKTELDN
jgi:hypothetical protein